MPTYALRTSLPVFLERGENTTLEARVYADGETLTGPSSGTCTVRDGNGATVSTGAASIASSVSSYGVTSAQLSSKAYAANWSIQWDLVFSGVTYTFREACVLCRVAPQRSATVLDLYAVQGNLNPTTGRTLSAAPTAELEEAWKQLIRRLMSNGRLPWAILDQGALRDAHVYLALALIYERLNIAAPNASFEVAANTYKQHAETHLRSCVLSYESQDAPGLNDPTRKVGAQNGGVWLSSGRRKFGGYGGFGWR